MANVITYSAAGSFTWTAPPGVYSVTLECWGAMGGWIIASSGGSAGHNGLGGYAKGDLAVIPGDVLHVYVPSYYSSSHPSGFGSGGLGGPVNSIDLWGGGAAMVFKNSTAWGNVVCVGGGGRSGGGTQASDYWGNGGNGGGSTAASGAGSSSPGGSVNGGAGGTQSTGGANGIGQTSNDTYDGTNYSGNCPWADGGGGGGGYFGGLAGSSAQYGTTSYDNGAGGGGGSNYVGALSNTTSTQGAWSSFTGQAQLTYVLPALVVGTM